MATNTEYPPIANHGLIGDLQTAALVSSSGEIDWFCCPRFDSPSVFASLLDRVKGGRFKVAPEGEHVIARQVYLPDSTVLTTRFSSPDGVGEVLDLMPPCPGAATDHHLLIRLIHVVRGQMRFRIECEPRFDYGRTPHTLELRPGGAVFHSAGLDLTLGARGIELERSGEDVRTSITMHGGQITGLVLESQADGPPGHLGPLQLRSALEETVTFWRRWLARSTYSGRWREYVNRSAITLKLMTYAPTGALIAAPTTSLPEQVGGERNWDYRFTWVRDASFSVRALLGLGFIDEASVYIGWLLDRVREQAGDESGPLKVMYRVDGSSDLEEESLTHLEGYCGSRPVRIGNGAADQLQLDTYGEAMNSIYLAEQAGALLSHQDWVAVCDMIDWLCEHWSQPEEGIWETRGGRRDFVYGRFMTWLALDKATRLAFERGLPAHTNRWMGERDNVYREVMARGWNAERGAFMQYYGSDVLDASTLLMPVVGFIAPSDPMWQSTLKAIDHELVSDSLVYRYNPEASPDGLTGSEGTFSLCTFWYVAALARSGRIEEARITFEKMLTYSNHLGLYSEEIGMTGHQLGNFPQAFTHLSLITAAIDLDDTMNATGDFGEDFDFVKLASRFEFLRRPRPGSGRGGARAGGHGRA